MDNDTQVFMPLRSNAAWFGDAQCRERLERQIKTYLVLYDRIVVENGRFRITAGVDGQGMQMMCPGDSFPGDRTKISFFTPGGAFGATFGDKTILASTAQSTYDVDYMPILHDAGLKHASCIEWRDLDVPPEFGRSIDQRVSEDLLNEPLVEVLPENRYVQKHVLHGLYHDSLIAHFLKSPFCVDFHASPVIEVQRHSQRSTWSAELPVALLDYWINLDLPDFAGLSWQDVCKFRETSCGVSFRHMIHSVSERARKILPEAADQRELDGWLAKEFSKELLAELSHRLTTPGGTLASLCLNVIPYGIIPSVLKDVKAWYDDRASWVSIVRRRKRG